MFTVVNILTKKLNQNCTVHIECKTLIHVVESATEAETGGLCHNCQTGVYLRLMLEAVGCSQPAASSKIDRYSQLGRLQHETICTFTSQKKGQIILYKVFICIKTHMK